MYDFKDDDNEFNAMMYVYDINIFTSLTSTINPALRVSGINDSLIA